MIIPISEHVAHFEEVEQLYHENHALRNHIEYLERRLHIVGMDLWTKARVWYSTLNIVPRMLGFGLNGIGLGLVKLISQLIFQIPLHLR